MAKNAYVHLALIRRRLFVTVQLQRAHNCCKKGMGGLRPPS
jgi:hypothetical protein